jgi:hypothetical protein
MCTCVSEEGGDGEAARSETPSLLLYTRRYVNFAEVVNVCRVPFREPIHLCTYVSEEVGEQGGIGGGWGRIKCTIVNRSSRIRRVCNFCEHE